MKGTPVPTFKEQNCLRRQLMTCIFWSSPVQKIIRPRFRHPDVLLSHRFYLVVGVSGLGCLYLRNKILLRSPRDSLGGQFDGNKDDEETGEESNGQGQRHGR